MAKGYSNFTLKVGKVTFNDVVCSCPIIDIVSVGSDILPNCCYDEKSKSLTGQIKDNPDSIEGSNCITFWVKCSENDCVGAQLITRCICNGDNDCGDCEICQDGFCVNRCKEGQFCDDDKCVDCLPGTCVDGKVCKNGKCVCPEGSVEVDGKCVECDPLTFNENCKICIDGKVVDVDCDKACNPATGECVDCVATSQCTKDNECCKDNSCDCCPGYTRNNCTGECVVIPQNACTDENSCGECSDCINFDPCTGYGTCSKTKCPTGFVCYKGECIPECDCDNPQCTSRTSYCGEVNAFECGCFNCPSDSCIEGDGSCESGSNRNCICNPQTNQCENDPCKDVVCPAGFICINGQCVKEEEECDSSLTLTKIEDGANCDLKASLDLDCCPCPTLDVLVTPSVDGTTITFDSVFSKEGNRLSDNQPTNNIAGNEEPNFGRISYYITYQNTTTIVDSNGFTVAEFDQELNGPTGLSDAFDGQKDELQAISQVDTAVGGVVSQTTTEDGSVSTTTRSGIRIDLYLEQTNVSGSDCTYEKQLIKTLRLESEEEYNNITPFTAQVVSTDCANPLFKWSKDGVVIRKIYIPGEGPYEDTLFGPDAISNDEVIVLPSNEGLLESCHNYTIEVDCDCDGPKSEFVKFCKTVDDFTATQLDICATEILYNIPSTCDVNEDLEFDLQIGEFREQWNGGDLPQSDRVTLSEPAEFAKLVMYCKDGSIACEKVIQFNTSDISINTVYDCPSGTITFDRESEEGIRVTDIIINGSSLGGYVYNVQSPSGNLAYTVVFANGCKDFTNTVSWICDCEIDPCRSDAGVECGTFNTNCGRTVTCGCNEPLISRGECSGNGIRNILETTYSCIGNVCVQNPTTIIGTETDLECLDCTIPAPQASTVTCGVTLSSDEINSFGEPCWTVTGTQCSDTTVTNTCQVIQGQKTGNLIISTTTYSCPQTAGLPCESNTTTEIEVNLVTCPLEPGCEFFYCPSSQTNVSDCDNCVDSTGEDEDDCSCIVDTNLCNGVTCGDCETCDTNTGNCIADANQNQQACGTDDCGVCSSGNCLTAFLCDGQGTVTDCSSCTGWTGAITNCACVKSSEGWECINDSCSNTGCTVNNVNCWGSESECDVECGEVTQGCNCGSGGIGCITFCDNRDGVGNWTEAICQEVLPDVCQCDCI